MSFFMIWIWTSTIKQVSLFWHQQTFLALLSCTVYCTFRFLLSCIPSPVLFKVYFHTVISMFCFLCYWSHLKPTLLIKRFNFAFIKRSTIDHSVKRTSCNSWKWRAICLSNIIYIKLQNFYFFSLRSILKEVLLKGTQMLCPLFMGPKQWKTNNFTSKVQNIIICIN